MQIHQLISRILINLITETSIHFWDSFFLTVREAVLLNLWKLLACFQKHKKTSFTRVTNHFGALNFPYSCKWDICEEFLSNCREHRHDAFPDIGSYSHQKWIAREVTRIQTRKVKELNTPTLCLQEWQFRGCVMDHSNSKKRSGLWSLGWDTKLCRFCK